MKFYHLYDRLNFIVDNSGLDNSGFDSKFPKFYTHFSIMECYEILFRIIRKARGTDVFCINFYYAHFILHALL